MTGTATILVVDDEVNLRRTLALILQREGYVVTTAENGKTARDNLKAGAYDLVFLDLKLPDTSGLTLLPELRSQYPDMPVLILTAHATLDSAMEAVRQGARDYLLKPIDPPLILARVKEILAEQQQPRRRRELVSQIQGLLSELHQIDGVESPPPTVPSVMPPTDPARYLRRGPLTIDLHSRHVSKDDQFIPLPPSTFDYLVTLVRHAPNAVGYETLVAESQGYSLGRRESREMARWQIHEIRKALEAEPSTPRMIITVRDVGYRLVA